MLKGRILDPPDTLALLKSVCAEHLSASEAVDLFAAYNIPASTPAQNYRSLLELASDLRFYHPALAAYLGWKTTVPSKYCRRYHFHAYNPVEGLSRGLASHEFDVSLLLNNYEFALDESKKGVAKQMADQWIRFANGEGWCEEGKLVVIGNSGVISVEEKEYDVTYRKGRGKILDRIGTERLWTISEAWQGVKRVEIVKSKL